jgi:hypothetical protein
MGLQTATASLRAGPDTTGGCCCWHFERSTTRDGSAACSTFCSQALPAALPVVLLDNWETPSMTAATASRQHTE